MPEPQAAAVPAPVTAQPLRRVVVLIVAYNSRADLEECLGSVCSSREPGVAVEVVVVDNDSINAFAVPGGVVGVHTGLFQRARTEHELASVLTHELAHLSQRHFARRLDAQRRASTVGLAGLLAGLVLAARRSASR